MRRPGRRLSAEEAAIWTRVAQSVTPLDGRESRWADDERPQPQPLVKPQPTKPARRIASPAGSPAVVRRPEPVEVLDRHGLDAGWDRRLSRGLVAPEFTLDLHGATLDAAHGRLEHGLALAIQQRARLVLLITGRHRPSEERAGRGVIRRKFMDWLAAGPHAGQIAAVRPAHPRHGGAGAVYIVLRRTR